MIDTSKPSSDFSQLSIKEFAEIAGISQSALRFYDKKQIFVPYERGENNYRRYAPFQAVTVNYVNVLVDLGVPLAQIKQLAQQREPEDILDLLEDCEERLDQQLNHIQMAYSVVHTMRNRIQRGMMANVDTISIVHKSESRLVLGPRIDWSAGESFYRPFIDFCQSAKENRVNLNYPIGGYHESMDFFVEAPFRPTRFYSVDPSGQDTRGPGEFLIGYERGYYGELSTIAERMSSYAAEHGLRFIGPVYTDYLLDEISVTDHSQYLAQLAVEVAPIHGTRAVPLSE